MSEKNFKRSVPVPEDHLLYQDHLRGEAELTETTAPSDTFIIGAEYNRTLDSLQRIADKPRFEGMAAELSAQRTAEIDYEIDRLQKLYELRGTALRVKLVSFFETAVHGLDLSAHPDLQAVKNKPILHEPDVHLAFHLLTTFADSSRAVMGDLLENYYRIVAEENTLFQERMAGYKKQFLERAQHWAAQFGDDLPEAVMTRRINQFSGVLADPLSIEYAFRIASEGDGPGNRAGSIGVNQGIILTDASRSLLIGNARSKARAVEQEEQLIMHELVHGVISGRQPLIHISGPDKADVDRLADLVRQAPSDQAAYDDYFEVWINGTAQPEIDVNRLGMQYRTATFGKSRFEWLNEARTERIRCQIFDTSFETSTYQTEQHIMDELSERSGISDSHLNQAYIESGRPQDTHTRSRNKDVHAAVTKRFGTGFMVQLDEMYHANGPDAALDFLRAQE